MDSWVNFVKESIKNKINFLKKSRQIYNTSPLLQNEKVRQSLKDL